MADWARPTPISSQPVGFPPARRTISTPSEAYSTAAGMMARFQNPSCTR